MLFCREAAEAAGVHVLRMIHEPAAALLAYNVGQDYSSGNRYRVETSAERLENNRGKFKRLIRHLF